MGKGRIKELRCGDWVAVKMSEDQVRPDVCVVAQTADRAAQLIGIERGYANRLLEDWLVLETAGESQPKVAGESLEYLREHTYEVEKIEVSVSMSRKKREVL